MTGIASIKAIKTVNFIVGFALLAMLCPHHGAIHAKPAGMRTAVQAASKKTTLGISPLWFIGH